MSIKIKVKELQFPKYFLLHELDLHPVITNKMLETIIEVRDMGEPDSVTKKGSVIYVSQPSSITKFLFNVLYHLISDRVKNELFQDKLSLGLFYACRDYTHNDFRPSCIGQPPLLMTTNKVRVLSLIMDDIIGPLVGKKELPSVMYINCNFLDSCSISEDANSFSKAHHCPHRSVSFGKYPFLVSNTSIHNKAAIMAHMLIKSMELSFGEEKAHRIVKNLILDEDSSIIQYVLTSIRVLEGDPGFVLDFLKFFESSVHLTLEEEHVASCIQTKFIKSDKFWNDKIKTAQAKYTPQVFKQWHQWSIIQGLIEKQLTPMRGSMWPASENIKPLEDEHRRMEAEKTKKKGKTQLNFEELLELAREWYGHKAVQPGQLHEVLLRENRVWK